jgi:hypothetical protein
MRYSGVVNRFSAILAAIISIGIAQEKLSSATCPCDIYATAGTPCVAAYSTVRTLYSTYTGPLYQVRATANNATKDIPQTSRGIADAAVQDAFLGTGAGTISKLYDQSGRGNHLVKAPGGSANGTTDKESNAKAHQFSIGGHTAYALYMGTGEGYRNNACSGIPTGTNAQGIYAVEDGTHPGCCCCFDFGNAETNNQADGTGSMNSLYFGVGYWGKGAGSGPWFMGDFEAGVWSGGAGGYSTATADPSMTMSYAFGIVKTNTNGTQPTYCIRVANATSGNLTNVWDGNFTTAWHMGGAMILGIGGDNSNSSYGTFYEGALTAGRPSNATDSLILKNVQAAAYGSTVVKTLDGNKNVATATLFNVRYNPSSANAVISYTMQDARRVSMNIFDQQGRRVAVIINGIIPAGRHEAVWDAKQVPAGVYVCRTAIDGVEGWSGRIVIGK